MSSNPTPDGDIPADAYKRLKEMKGEAGKSALFTSDLSINEFLLVKEAGFEPLGLVVGSSIYHIGHQSFSASVTKNQEMTVLTQVMYHARELAMLRMEEEANALGADGVVGVRLEIRYREWGESIAEFVAVGTAIKARDGKPWRNAKNMPFTSDLSGQELWTLLKSGYRPVGLVMGNCVYWIAIQSLGKLLRQAGQNMEMKDYTQGLYDSRELAMERMQAEARDLGARGIVGMHMIEGSHGWGAHVIEFFAVGTAVIPIDGAQPVAAPALVLPLSDSPNISFGGRSIG